MLALPHSLRTADVLAESSYFFYFLKTLDALRLSADMSQLGVALSPILSSFSFRKVIGSASTCYVELCSSVG